MNLKNLLSLKLYQFIYIFILFSVYCSAQSNLSLLSNEYNTFFTEVDCEIWIASAGKGYNRYRGIETKHYFLNDSSGLKGTFIQSPIFKDGQGLLWTSTYEYLCVYDLHKDQFHSFQLVIKGDTVKTGYKVFHYAATPNLIYARIRDQLVTIDATSHKIKQILGPTKGNEFTINDNTIIGAPWHIDKGIEIWQNQNGQWSKKHEYFSACEPFKDMLITKCFFKDDKWWLLTTIGLVEFDIDAPCLSKLYTFTNITKNNSITDGFQKGNLIYTASDKNGVQIFDTNQKKFIVNKNQVIEKVDYIFVDEKDRIWKSNIKFGIEVLPKSKFSDEIKTFNKGIWSDVITNNENRILLDSENGFFISNSTGEKRIKTGSISCPLPYIHQMFFIDDERLILCGYQELGIYHISKGKYLPIKLPDVDGIQNTYVKNNKLSIVTNNKVKVSDINTWQNIVNPTLNPYQGSLQSTIYLSESLNIYVSSSSHVLIQSFNKIKDIDIGSYINSAIYIPGKREIIVGTNDGLILIDTNHNVTNLFDHHPILSNQACFKLQYQDGYVYFGSERNIGRINLSSKTIQLVDVSAFKFRPTFTLEDNNMYLVGDHYYQTSVENAFKTNHDPVLKLDFLKVRDVFKSTEPKIKLTSKENSLTWKYYIQDIYHPDGAIIQYKLKGIDNIWITIKNGENITFSNLASGHYKLQVMGINSLGVKSQMIEQHFTISVPWYKSLWFYVLLVMIGATSFYLLYRSRMKNLIEKHEIELQISNLQRSALQAQMNPHFIFNCLNSIQNFIMQNEKLEAMDYLNRFAHLIRQNLDASTSSTIILSDEIEMLRNYVALEQLRFGHKFDFSVQLDDHIDADHTFIPPLLIQPFVENAIIHGISDITYRGMIHVDIVKTPDLLKITIKDNGRGMSQEKQNKEHKSLAMSITSRRLDFINTTKDKNYNIKTTSSEKGTEVTITVDLGGSPQN